MFATAKFGEEITRDLEIASREKVLRCWRAIIVCSTRRGHEWITVLVAADLHAKLSTILT